MDSQIENVINKEVEAKVMVELAAWNKGNNKHTR